MASQEKERGFSEPEYTKVNDRKKYPFYHPNIEHKIPPETQDLLEKYAHVPRERQSEHVHAIRDRAFDIRAYPCTGLGSWLVPQSCRLPVYHEILELAKNGATVMDIGTFLGHDLRRLVFDGAPSEKLYGVDIASHFDVGYDFFCDRERFKGHFIEADFLSTSNPELTALKGSVDIIIISQVLHQWDWDHQVKAAKALTTAFTKPGSMIVGNQIGSPQAHEIFNKPLSVGAWRHNPESFAKMWKSVGEATGTQWQTQAWLRTFPEMGWDPNDAKWMEPDVRLMEFVATRVA